MVSEFHYSPDDTDEGEMASALLGGVGVLVSCTAPPAEFELLEAGAG